MNRSSKGFGLTGVIATVLILAISAIFSSSANSAEFDNNAVHVGHSQANHSVIKLY